MRTVSVLAVVGAVAFLVAATTFAENAKPIIDPTIVDLDKPGVLEQLQRDNPKHYEAVTKALRVAQSTPCPKHEVEALKARYDVDRLSCATALATTHPPKRSVKFSIDGTAYRAVVTITDTIAEFKPLDAQNGSKH